MKDPLRLQMCDILRSNLGKTAEAPARVVAVVSGPIGVNLRRRIRTGAHSHHQQSTKLHALNALHR